MLVNQPLPISILRRMRDGDILLQGSGIDIGSFGLVVQSSRSEGGFRCPTAKLSDLGRVVLDLVDENARLREEMGRHTTESVRSILKLREEIDGLKALLADLFDPDACVYDHHDLCQSHGLQPKPCPHERILALFRAEAAAEATELPR